ncbi:uncharacterized protein J7T54_004498 [Emericellopsis cladophorae]|uniref:Ubiquitin carboxyl-terminal hydrolase n=1 Tax=Emericellopsis cladophorae TaxID=2686198 RepID=A0A9P9XWN7_9HYPO|nr:uncharacterized protein J7T54_004498 [Emericellopsis cladophorae]KAI6779003.1 hypothetical protein J7T54_004498 [Emericellopsis cladophorae]
MAALTNLSSNVDPDPGPAAPAFIPLECNPELMTDLIHQLGASKKLEIQQIWSLEPSEMDFYARPAHALMLVFPVTATYETARMAEDTKTEYSGKGPQEPVMWFKQTIKNACGFMALLHAVANVPSKDTLLEEGSTLHKIITESTNLGPLERARLLENSKELADAYKVAASGGDTAAPDAEDQVDLHYVCFVKGADGQLWELDGRRAQPLARGLIGNQEDMLGENALTLGAKKFLEDGKDNKQLSESFAAVALIEP